MKIGNDTSYFNQAWPPYILENSEFVTVFRLAVFEFVIDLSPAYSKMETLKKKAFDLYGDKGWTWIPNVADNHFQ
ncbi:MAG: hypothetical protein EWV63_14005 [Microcystis aeruginosa Ma_OC_H_19870700_S124]|uniref:Uncharacterized protein n=1 Tax=Microcystis aeruginosa Ma_OC_H_19870700_S124 TaxID=2486262 RepID=A0A552AHU7_MICAE|nr:MAG: hypothetical protein EWV63_14005 [Microcystis aeruginosa Ma_OC_H_19870700_S124]